MGHGTIFDGPRPGVIENECVLQVEPSNQLGFNIFCAPHCCNAVLHYEPRLNSHKTNSNTPVYMKYLLATPPKGAHDPWKGRDSMLKTTALNRKCRVMFWPTNVIIRSLLSLCVMNLLPHGNYNVAYNTLHTVGSWSHIFRHRACSKIFSIPIPVRNIVKFESPIPVQTLVTIDSTEIKQYLNLSNDICKDHADSCFCRK